MNKKWNILYITDVDSTFAVDTQLLDQYFEKSCIVPDTHKALKLIYNTKYDAIIHDITNDPLDGMVFLKQIKEMKPDLPQIAFVLPNDEEKIGGLIDSGVHTFLLMPEQLEQAFEAIKGMNFQVEKKS